ncbi:MAG: CBASS oligonucleotide cyclase [Allomuricauda sp.]|uniref:Nucleotidyltransferase n=1 Tax=Flagellimonas oceani TaxID=2698672 RepID=A0A6G7J7K7_9FLAO|nr:MULTISPECIES: CBASS oligonucleotide cyclase [Allomuricauda]MBW8241902.1 nucleotidyltransferase [Allomuricauda oceani]QII46815.1 nucleotidyltransferase [Allomuricauda oceani]
MKLDNNSLRPFIDKIRLHKDNMPKYRDQINNLKKKLEEKIENDESNGLKVTKYLLAGSWKKHTILRPTGDNPIDIDLVLFVSGDENIHNDLKKLHDFIVEYLQEIYPQKDITQDVDAEGNTKSIKIRFSGSGLEVDIVPVVPIENPENYVWQPQRGGGGKYITSVENHLSFSVDLRKNNPSYTSIVRALKWWKNYKELKPYDDEPGISSFCIELIVAYLDITKGIETDIEEAIIRFFQFLSESSFPEIEFAHSINTIPYYTTPIYIADDTNNENNAAKKIDDSKWKEIVEEAEDAFDSLNLAQSRNNKGTTVDEWKRVFGPTFSIN